VDFKSLPLPFYIHRSMEYYHYENIIMLLWNFIMKRFPYVHTYTHISNILLKHTIFLNKNFYSIAAIFN